jgi:arylsulfatase A-like enzyme
VIILYADDLGYGDLGCYGSSIPTPHIDRLAKNGLRFTDAHSTASTCTPSRYSLLTGNYAFRKNANILGGKSALLIPTETRTLADLFKEKGYATGVVGKWHLGLGDGSEIDWNNEVKPGPLEIGFDYSYIIPVTGDRVPAVFLENYKVDDLQANDSLLVSFVDDPTTMENPYDEPDGLRNPERSKQRGDKQHSGSITNGISRVGYMAGGNAARYIDEELPMVLNSKAIGFIEKNKKQPFFLYFPFHDIHVPRLPNEMFQGKTSMGTRGDAIVQMDWMVGELIKKLEELGLAENTLIIFSSDNGPIVYDGYMDQSAEMIGDHKPAGIYS